MLSLYQSAQASTAVKHSCFFKPVVGEPPVLAVARTSAIDIYRVHARPSASTHLIGGEGRAQLHLISTFDFSGTIKGLQPVTLRGSAARAAAAPDASSSSSSSSSSPSQQDVLLVTFEGAKVTLLGLDPFSQQLKTLAMLNHDENAIGPGSAVRGQRYSLQQPGVLGDNPAWIDPLNRLAAVGVYDGQIALLPFAGTSGDQDAASSSGGGGSGPSSSSLGAPNKTRTSYGLLGDADGGDALAQAGEYSDAATAAMDALTSKFIPQPYLLNLQDHLNWSGLAAAASAAAASATVSGSVGGGSGADTTGALTAANALKRAGGIPDHSVTAVRDGCFLSRYDLLPALALLSQQYPASTNRIGSIAHTCALTVVSVDVSRKRHNVIWRREGLPHDCFACVPVPEPYGGVLVLSPHSVHYFNQYRYTGVALNAFAAATVDTMEYPLHAVMDRDGKPNASCVEIGGCTVKALSPSTYLLGLRDGSLQLLQLHPSGGSAAKDEVGSISLTSCGIMGAPTSTFAVLPADNETCKKLAAAAAAGDNGETKLPASNFQQHDHYGLLFMGSPCADSVLSLYLFRDRHQPPKRAAHTATSAALADGGGGADGGGLHNQLDKQEQRQQDVDEEDAAIYAAAAASSAVSSSSSSLPGASTTTAAVGAGGGAMDDEDAFLYGGAASSTAAASSVAASAAGSAAVTAAGAGAAGGGGGGAADGTAKASEGSGSDKPLRLWLIDSLPSIAPVVDMCYGKETKLAGADDDAPPSSAASTELVAFTGQGHSATVSVLHRGLKADHSTELKLPGVTGLWFVRCRAEAAAAAAEGQEEGHHPQPSGFCVLSMPSTTRVFSISEGMVECNGEAAAGFVQDAPTLAFGSVFCAGSIVDVTSSEPSSSEPDAPAPLLKQAICDGQSQRFVQVHRGGIRILTGDSTAGTVSEVMAGLPLDVGGLDAQLPDGSVDAVCGVDILDPYCLIRLGSGRVRLLRPDTSEDTPVAPSEGSGKAPVVQGELDLVVDVPPWEANDASNGSAEQPRADDDAVAAAGTSPEAAAAARRVARRVVSACLFRDNGTFYASVRPVHAAKDAEACGSGVPVKHCFAALARRNGELSIHLLPSWETVYVAANAHIGPAVMVSKEHEHKVRKSGPKSSAKAAGSSPTVDEAGEPCDDEEVPVDAGSGSGSASSSWTKIPRTYIRELSARVSGDSGVLHLVAITSRDDLHAYSFVPSIPAGRHKNTGLSVIPSVDASSLAATSAALGGVAASSPLGFGGDSFGSSSAAAAAAAALHHHHTMEEDAFDFGGNAGSAAAGAAAASSAATATTSAADAAAAAVFIDSTSLLQHHLATALPRFIRIKSVSTLITRAPLPEEDGSPANTNVAELSNVPPPEEHYYKSFSPRRLVPFTGVAGWSGWACLTPSPAWLFNYRGTVAPVRMFLNDNTGAGGPTAVAGDVLHTVSPLAAFSPFSSASIPDGFVLAYGSTGHLHFGRLPRPAWTSNDYHSASGEDSLTIHSAYSHSSSNGGWAWPLHAPLAPQRVPFGLLHDTDAAAAVASLASSGTASQEDIAAATAAGHFKFASAAAVSAVFSALSPYRPAAGEGLVEEVADSAAGPLMPLPAVAGSGSSVEVPAELLPAGPMQSGATVAFQRRLGAVMSGGVGTTPYHGAYLELASASAGASALTSWHKRRVTGPNASSLTPAQRLPPTATQLGCAVYPLYALAVSSLTVRDHATELAIEMAATETEGGFRGGEVEAVHYGKHVEILDKKLSEAATAASGSANSSTTSSSSSGMDPKVAALNPMACPTPGSLQAGDYARSLSSIASLGIPPVYDPLSEVVLVAGTGSPDPSLEPLDGPMQGSYGSSTGWTTVLDRFPLKQHERVLCMKEVPLIDKPGSYPVSTLLVGTGLIQPRGHDAPAPGRLLVFRIHDKDAPGPDTAAVANAAVANANAKNLAPPSCLTSKFSLQLVCEITRPFPVTAITSLAVKDLRHVVVGIGKGVVVYAWKPRAGVSPQQLAAVGVRTPGPETGTVPGTHFLEPINFHEGHVWIRDLASVSQFILYGDGLAGMRFLQWREEDKSTIPLARDQNRLPTTAIELLIHDKTLGLMGSDDDGNLLLLGYAPKEGGERLLTRADFRLSSPIYRMLRARFAVPQGTPVAARKKFVVYLSTLGGEVGTVIPVEEGTYKRLLALQRLMVFSLPHLGGLHPRLWRALDNKRMPARERMGAMLDGAFLWSYLSLDGKMQKHLAKRLGAGLTADIIIDLLKGLDLSGTGW